MKNRIMTVNTVFVENLEDAVMDIEKFFEEQEKQEERVNCAIAMTKHCEGKKSTLIIGYEISNYNHIKQYYIEIWYDNNRTEGNFDYPIEVYKLSEDKEERRIALYAAIDVMNAAVRGEYETVEEDPKMVQLEEAIKEAVLTGETKIKYKPDGATRARRWVIYYMPHESGGVLKLKAVRQTYAEKAVVLNDLQWGIGEAAGELCDYLDEAV